MKLIIPFIQKNVFKQPVVISPMISHCNKTITKLIIHPFYCWNGDITSFNEAIEIEQMITDLEDLWYGWGFPSISSIVRIISRLISWPCLNTPISIQVIWKQTVANIILWPIITESILLVVLYIIQPCFVCFLFSEHKKHHLGLYMNCYLGAT